MNLTLLAIGRLGRSPEAALVEDYVRRAGAAGRALGFAVSLVEVESKKPGKAAEAEALAPHLAGAHVIACDERGRSHPSRAFAARLETLRDRGVRRVVLVIGGADGLDPDLVARADETLAFGVQTWPHALARVMLAEQVYRAMSILGGSPYHRD